MRSYAIYRVLVDYSDRLIVILLVVLRMTVDEAIVEFVIICLAVFGEQSKGYKPQERMEKLQATVENLLRRREIPIDAKMLDPEREGTKCLGYVFPLVLSLFFYSILLYL